MNLLNPYLTFILAVLALPVPAAEFHVSPTGSDANSGALERPFATLEKARAAARGQSDGKVWVHGGTYRMDQPLVLTPEDSCLTLQAYQNETPVLSGGQPVTGWKKLTDEPAGVTAAASGNLWTADIPKGWCFHYLYVDGMPMPRARLHNTHWRKWPQDFSYAKPTRDGQVLTFKNPSILRHIPANGDVEMICIMDDMAEYFTITGNVIWVNGRAACGTIGMRPNERGNVIHDNIRAAFQPEHADGGGGNADGIRKGFYTTDPSREPVDRLLESITGKVKAAGDWPGNPDTGIPRPGEEIKDAVQRLLPKGSHQTIE